MQSLINAGIEALPPLPQTISELQKVCLDEETTIKQVANIIEKDPFLTAELIKYANSPIYGYARQIHSVFQAVSMFGISTAKGLAIASAVKSSFQIDLSPYKISTKDFVNSANLKSAFLLQWYDNKREFLGILMPCALVMHIGMVVITDCLKKQNKGLEFAQQFYPKDFLESENRLINCNQFKILGLLFEHWNFESTMVQTANHLLNDELPTNLVSYVYPLRVINALINPFSIANEAQIQAALQNARNYQLNLESFYATLENLETLQKLV
ncbi:HDOD domain-containing protein [Helicobacter winghamensis]|uniref:HDOD domain-containing protein n=1 Tax=Helicobacter winghamensis TaxID=157268 RepID=UPI0027A661FA